MNKILAKFCVLVTVYRIQKTCLSTGSFNGIGTQQRDMQIVMCIKASSNAAFLREKDCIRRVVVSTKASTKTTKCEGGKRSSDFC